MSVTVDSRGDLFDGGIARRVRRASDAAADEIGQLGVRTVRAQGDASFRNPTGHFRARVRADRTPGVVVVHTRGVPYTRWLEGVDPRNSTTRFKGYRLYRRAAVDLRRAVPALAGRIFVRHFQ